MKKLLFGMAFIGAMMSTGVSFHAKADVPVKPCYQ
ncbi:hypothetical protein SAMN06265367_10763 [Algoriphagus winogradskyi]|uniref:Uncharacterized protein n=1 Tax=Algoriphagus winogradskyi TaxID=237017 RepID=A0ABY1PDC8_9BACT|nr:hypothetical protein SAMN06265367_10763 [Algoriphagus winogradskyi]